MAAGYLCRRATSIAVSRQFFSLTVRLLGSDVKGVEDGSQSEQTKRPSKPLNPYFAFLCEKRRELIKSNPKLRYKEVLKFAGELWNNLPKEEKKKYIDNYDKEREEFKKQDETWWNLLSSEEKQDFMLSKEKQNKKRLKKIHFNKLLDLGRPRRPLSAINYFVADEYNSLKHNNSKQKSFASIAEVWRRMSEKERKPYDEMARMDFERFSKEKLVWELKMMREGKGNLIDKFKPKIEAVRKKRTE